MAANSTSGADDDETSITVTDQEIRASADGQTEVFDYDPDTRVATYRGEGFAPSWAEAAVKRTGAFLE